MQNRSADVPLQEVLRNLRTQEGLEAFGRSTPVSFWRGLWAGLTFFLLKESWFGGFFVAVLGTILSAVLLTVVGLKAGARLLSLLLALGGLVHAWLILRSAAEAPSYTSPDHKSWDFEPEPGEEHLRALLDLLTLVRPLAQPDAMVHLSWSGTLYPTLLARLSLRDGSPLAVALYIDKHSWESLFLLGEERVSLDALAPAWSLQGWRNTGPLEGQVTQVELSLERRGDQWVDRQEQPVPHARALLGEKMAQLLASRLWGEPRALHLLRRSPVDLPDPASPREAARMSLARPSSWRSRARSGSAYLWGLWLGALPWLLSVLVLARAGLDMNQHGTSLWDASSTQLVLGVASFLALRLGAILYKQQKVHTAPPVLREADPTLSTPEVSLVGPHLTAGAQSVDLSQPFSLHIYTQQTRSQRPEALLEVLPRGASPQERLRLRVPLRPEGEYGHLPRLEAEAVFVAPAFFLEHLWPSLAGWSQLHGDFLEVDFAAQVEVAPGLPLEARAASVVDAEIGVPRRR